MASIDVNSATSTEMPEVGTVDMKLEVVTLPVSDVDRAKRFTRASDGGSTPTSPSVTPSVWSS